MYVANHLSSEQLRRIAKQQTQAKLLLRLLLKSIDVGYEDRGSR